MKIKIPLIIGCLLASTLFVKAQDTLSVKNKWSFLAEVYLMFPNMSGTVGLGDLPDASVDASPGDVFSHLQMGAMFYLEAGKGKWSITSDFLYMSLEQDVSANSIINSGKAGAKQTAWELAGLYKINAWLEAGAGARWNSMNGELELNIKSLPPGTEITRSKSLTRSWVDPILVTRIKVPLKGKWLLQLRADIGGFGTGSEFAWQAQLDAGYKFSKLFQATLGYRYIDINYEKGLDEDRFLYDVSTFGPVIRFGFNF